MPAAGKLQAWKKDYPDGIHKIEVGDSFCIIRHPSMMHVSMASSLSTDKTTGKVDDVESARVYLENCWLYGDESIKTDISKLKAVAKTVNSLFKVLPTAVTEFTSSEFGSLPIEIREKLVGHEVVKEITIVDGENVLKSYFKIPDMEIRGMATLNGDFLTQGQVYAEKCFICGDEVLTARDEIKCALYIATHRLYRTFDVKLVKL